MKRGTGMRFTMAAGAAAILLLGAEAGLAHCDTMAGPLIPEAQAALEKGEVTPILKWIGAGDEKAIREAFAKAVAVRAKGPEAKELADHYFLETLVRLHRAGEGAPYTGIKNEPVAPVVAMADKALAEGSAEAMVAKIRDHVGKAIQAKFDKVLAAKQNKDKSVEDGRAYVAAYVEYTHFVEGIHDAVMKGAGHGHAAPAAPEKKADPHQH